MRDHALPPDLPVPGDDGAADHLAGAAVPSVRLRSTRDRWIDVARAAPRFVLFAYPRAGRPGEPPPEGWDLIPGARGCTPQACAYRDLHAEFLARGLEVFGVSAQDTGHQQEFARRVHLPFDLLSDADGALRDAMRLPTFDHQGARLLKRLALVVEDGRVRKVFYPVFPPDRNAEDVLGWIAAQGV
ncbi:MAG TPA: peroxiredoxin [Candidatus Thermoplasmatota archaeon]|nr:peroxiredoxin [Candidatus Thermoplasmatota archaeon]